MELNRKMSRFFLSMMVCGLMVPMIATAQTPPAKAPKPKPTVKPAEPPKPRPAAKAPVPAKPTPTVAPQAAPKSRLAAEPQDTQAQMFLSLEEAVQLALQNNLDIQVQKYNPVIKREAISTAEAVFNLNLTAQGGETLNDPSTTSAPKYATSLQTGLSKRFATGTTSSVSVSTTRADFGGLEASVTVTDPQTGAARVVKVPIDTSYGSKLTLTLAQALLKNRGTEVNTAQIVIARKQQTVSLSALRASVISVITQVQNTYWQLLFARGNLDAKRLALQLANDLVKINEAQVKVGTLAPLDVLQARTAVAARELDVISAEKSVRDAEDSLKQLLNIAETDPNWGSAIIPTDAAGATQSLLTLTECLQAALANREELKQLQIAIEIQELAVRVAENQLLPELNLQGSLGATGEDTAWGSSMSNLAKLDTRAIAIGVNFSYPLGNGAAKSALNTAKFTLDQTRLSVQNVEKQITTQVKQAVRAVETAGQLVNASQFALQLAEQQLDAEQKKYNEGLSTNYLVLTYQQSRASAQSSYTQALTSYSQALAALEQAIGMTLQRHNIVVNE